jgi:hypothetical protein
MYFANILMASDSFTNVFISHMGEPIAAAYSKPYSSSFITAASFWLQSFLVNIGDTGSGEAYNAFRVIVIHVLLIGGRYRVMTSAAYLD